MTGSFRHFCRSIGLALLLAAPAQAQIVGVQGGLSFANLKDDDAEAPTLDWLTAPTAGLFVVFGPNVVTGRVDVLYTVKGARTDFGAYKISYLEAPVGVQFNVARGSNSDVHVFAQTTIGFKIDARIDYNDTGDDDELPEAEDFDFGITIGAGATFGKFVVDGRYTHGIRDISSAGSVIKTKTVAVTAGYRFN
jgi:Outer membrane protein beta-barrel domain